MHQQKETDALKGKPAPALQLAAGLLLLFLVFYWNSLSNLLHLWNTNETYSHGYFIPLLIIYLLTLKNTALKNVPLTPAPVVLVLLVPSSLIWLLASITSTQTVELTVLPFIFIFAYVALTGWQATRILFTSLAFIIVAVPIWGILTPYFQIMAVVVNEFILGLVGIPTHIQGTMVSIPAGNFDVEGGCAGIRYLVVTLALGGFYSLLNFRRHRPMIILIIASLLIPIVFNWIRIFSIILIGHVTDMESSLVEDHGTFGWFLYAISLVPLFIIASKLEQHEKQAEPASSSPAITHQQSYPKIYAFLVVGIFLLPAVFQISLSQFKPAALNEITAPSATAPWLGPIHMNDWHPAYKGASIEINKLYVGTDKYPDISLHIYYYGQQDQDKELINELNSITENKKTGIKNITNLERHPVIEVISIDKNKRHLIWYWYIANNKSLIKPSMVKINQAVESLSGKISSSLIALRIECNSSCEDRERDYLKGFLNTYSNKIKSVLKD